MSSDPGFPMPLGDETHQQQYSYETGLPLPVHPQSAQLPHLSTSNTCKNPPNLGNQTRQQHMPREAFNQPEASRIPSLTYSAQNLVNFAQFI